MPLVSELRTAGTPDEAELERLIRPLVEETAGKGLFDSAILRTICGCVINRRVRMFSRYRTYVENANSILDWGCADAIDACLMRMVNPEVDLHGCDVRDDICATTRRFSKLQYEVLEHPFRLPYDDSRFDVVISNGVLEHVPNDGESLKEIYRILRPSGFFLISFLPNHLSYTEVAARKIGFGHRRLYSLRELKRMLLHSGFEPIECGYHQLLPSLTSGHRAIPNEWLARAFAGAFTLDPILERVWPLKLFSANLFAFSRKVIVF